MPPVPGLSESAYNVWAHEDGEVRLFNGVSGFQISMSESQRDAVLTWLRQGHAQVAHEPLFERLVRARAVVPTNTDELANLKRRYQLAQHDPTHLGLTVVTSLGCNFDCPYCFESKSPALLDKRVELALGELLESRVSELSTFAVTWYGGEPLLGRQALLRLAAKFRETCDANGVEHHSIIVTNGWFLNAAVASQLVEVGVNAAQVTIDGPPDVHDKMRPHSNGQGTFDRIVANLDSVADLLPITVRVNLDRTNVARCSELLDLLADAGLAGRVAVALGHLVPVDHNAAAPSASYCEPCLTIAEQGQAELDFDALAQERGFATLNPPGPVGAPCTAVRSNEVIVGAKGELWKCFDDVGNSAEQIGTVFELDQPNNRLAKWLAFDPFADDECRSCVALPVCMGGCALFARSENLRDNRCSTFRYNHQERIREAMSEKSSRLAGAEVRLARLGVSASVPVALVSRPGAALAEAGAS